MIIFLLTLTFNLHAIFNYDRAIARAQKNDMQGAQKLLTSVIVDQPDRPDALYDLGVAAYKNKTFDTALSYFNKAATSPSVSPQLGEQATFNAGNAHVQLKQLREAIDAYDRILEKNPDHEPAHHNKEIVKKMMEQEKQKEQQQQKDKDKEDKQDQEEEDQKDQQKDQEKKDEQQNEQEKQENKEQQNDQGKQDQQKKDQGNEEDKKQPEQKKQNGAQKNREQKEEQKKQSEQQQGQQDKNDEQQPSPSDGQQEKSPPLSVGLARVLEEQGKKDAQLNKQMTKALVMQQAGGKHDYNCW